MQFWIQRLAVVRVCDTETPDSPSHRTLTAPARQEKGAAENCQNAPAAYGGGVPYAS